MAPVAHRQAADVSPKSRLATSLLAVLVGEFGVHRFYVGKIGTAAVMLVCTVLAYVLVAGALIMWLSAAGDEPWWIAVPIGILVGGSLGAVAGIWSIVDSIIALMGNFRDSQGRVIRNW